MSYPLTTEQAEANRERIDELWDRYYAGTITHEELQEELEAIEQDE